MKTLVIAFIVASCAVFGKLYIKNVLENVLINFLFYSAFSATSEFFAKETTAVNTAQKDIHKIEIDYEAAVRVRDAAKLKSLVETIKKSQTAVKTVRGEIEFYTESEHSDVSFFERIMLECLHIRTGIYAETLKTIAQEILGQENGLSDFPVYTYSEKIESARILLTEKFTNTLKLTQDTDAIMANAAKKNVSLTSAEKVTIGKNLDVIVKDVTAIHTQLSSVYFGEIELIHQQGRVLRLYQKMETESIVDEISFVVHFVTEFHKLFKEIVDKDP